MERARPVGVDFEKLPAERPASVTPNASPVREEPRQRSGYRAKAKVGEYEVYQLARMGCTLTEAGQFFGMKLSGFNARLDADPMLKLAWDRGAAQMKISLRRLQLAHASRPGAPGVAMTIHMSKHQLDEVDKQEIKHTGANDGPIEVTFNFDSPAAKNLTAQAHGSPAE